MLPFFSRNSGAPNALLSACLLLCPGFLLIVALTPSATQWAGSDRWCMVYRAAESLQILQGSACDAPQIGLVRRFD